MQGQLPLSDRKKKKKPKRVLYITDLEHAPLQGAKRASFWQPVWEKHSRTLQESTDGEAAEGPPPPPQRPGTTVIEWARRVLF